VIKTGDKPKKIDSFISSEDKTFSFNGCDACDAKCCNGARGSVYAPITLEDFDSVYQNFAIVFSFGDLGYPKSHILLNDGINYCKYLKNNKCTIYENRPSPCKTYPLSPTIFDEPYIDTGCPSVSESKENVILENAEIKSQNFKNDIFKNYSDIYIKTHHHLVYLKENGQFKTIIQAKDILFFAYIPSETTKEDKYVQMHHQSLIHLPKP